MNENRFKIKGIYLVLDPVMDFKELKGKLHGALEGGLGLVQIWNHWPETFSFQNKIDWIKTIKKCIDPYTIPLLINEDWELIKETALDGVHFDEMPENIDQIKKEIDRPVLLGLTCSNNLESISTAGREDFDYISFCSLFPSSSASNCEIVKPESIKRARELTDLPLFLSGGINLENVSGLKDYKVQGVALISGILNAVSSKKAVLAYKQQLKNNTQ